MDLIHKDQNLIRIFVKDYQTEAKIGAYDHEFGHTQKIRLNVEVYVTDEVENDELEQAYNYDKIVSAIECVVQQRHYKLQEYLVKTLIKELFKDEKVKAVNVVCEKLQVNDKAESIGVEFFKAKND